MFKSKSIFWKQFTVYMGIMLISLTILSAAASQAFRGYFVSQKEKLLRDQGNKITDIVLDTLVMGNSIFSGLTFQSRMYETAQYLHEYLDTSIIFIDANFKVIMATSDIPQSNGVVLDQKELLPLKEGEIVSIQGKLNDIFPMQVLTVAYPVVFGNKVVGAVLLNSSMPELQRTVSDIISITLICVLICATLAFVLIYWLSKNMSKPLLEMNEAAKVIASGDFEKRIKVQTKDEVGQLAESFNNMAESLYMHEQKRREFIANISHDIRSPLTSMRGFLQAILDGTIPLEKHEKYLSIVMNETERLTKLANDILDLNKIQALDIELDIMSFDINELIRKTVMMFEASIKDSKQQLNLILADESNVVSADYEKIQRVLQNLLDNAIKFTPEGGDILIETSISESKVQVKVKDTGCGISEEDKRNIFDRFFKTDLSRGNDKGGSGLGLSIVQAFIKAHGETIYVDSLLGHGSEFIFTLTLSEHNTYTDC